MKTYYLFILFLFCTPISAQKEKNHWYMGTRYGIKFDNGIRQVLPANAAPEYFSMGDASVSDPKTGALLFVANGGMVYDKNFTVMPGGDKTNSAAYTMAFPNLQYPEKYLIVYASQGNIYYAEVDMKLRGGLGDVTYRTRLLRSNAYSIFTGVKYMNTFDGFWIITHTLNSDEFQTFRVGPSGNLLNRVDSKAGSVISNVPISKWGNMTSNKAGTVVANAFIRSTTDDTARIELFDFDKCSGKIAFRQAISTYDPLAVRYPMQISVAFSSSDNYLYATQHSDSLSASKIKQDIYRYNWQEANPAATRYWVGGIDNAGFECGQMALAPDNNLYATMFPYGSTAPEIAVVKQPDGTASYSPNAFIFIPSATAKNFYFFPPFIMDTSSFLPIGINLAYKPITIDTSILSKPRLDIILPVCYNDSVEFYQKGFFHYNQNKAAYWDFGDGNTSKGLTGKYRYRDTGKYMVKLFLDDCTNINQPHTEFTLDILFAPPEVDLGPDTTLCAGTKYALIPRKGADFYVWSNGAKTDEIAITAPGTYNVKVQKGLCFNSDTVTIKYKPPIWVELGGEYYLCEDDSQTVKLDAGKGFEAYKWTPTGDTSQWIIVKKSGPYYVVVKDFMGCQGDDGTQVTRRCNVYGEVPNAFTPNGDGLNDVFLPFVQETEEYELTIYNRWGQKLFTTKSPIKGWDGIYKTEPCPDGVYFYTLTYTGYQNKILRKYNKKGTFNLIR